MKNIISSYILYAGHTNLPLSSLVNTVYILSLTDCNTSHTILLLSSNSNTYHLKYYYTAILLKYKQNGSI